MASQMFESQKSQLEMSLREACEPRLGEGLDSKALGVTQAQV